MLKNKLTWSFSRDRLFKECRRAYYYYYYASWGGWEQSADDFTKKAYILKNVRNVDMWIGDIVHQVIKWVLENKASGKEICCNEALKQSKQLLLKTWEQSRSKCWMTNVKKNLNLFEHYYDCEPTKENLVPKLKKVTVSIKNFYGLQLLEKISAVSKEKILCVDALDSFVFDGVKIFAVPDFALKFDGYILYDWKTGKPSDNDVLQLSCYMLYAIDKWNVLANQIKLIPVYLASESIVTAPINPLKEEDVKIYIRKSLVQMREIICDSADKKVDMDNCPKTSETWRCKKCRFTEICQ